MFKKNFFANEGAALIQEMLDEAKHSDYSVATRVVLITPELAGDFLASNFANNRVLRTERANEYARQMAQGQWTLAEAAIVFDASGRMVNGQHRLTACIQAGVPFLSIVAVGVDSAAILNLDTGYTRTVGQSLHIQGVGNASSLASLAEYVRLWERRRVTAPHIKRAFGLSRAERLEFIVSHELELKEALSWGTRVYNAVGTNRTAAALCYLVLKKAGGEELVERFFTGLVEGVMLPPGDPILLLQKRLRGDSRSRPDPWGQVYLIIKAWNMWRRGKRGQQLFWRSDEPVPEPVTD